MNRLVGVLLILFIMALASTASLGYLLTTSRPETTTTDTIVTTTVVSSTTTLTNVYVTNTFTSTKATYLQISGTNLPIFYVTEVVVVQPEVVNGICIADITNTTIQSTYYLPLQGINESNALGIVTTSTVYQNSSTKTVYDNVTIISNGTTTCTEINPHYNVTQSEGCVCV